MNNSTCIIKFLILIQVLLCTCEKGKSPDPGCRVYKTKGDYYNLVPVHLMEDKTKLHHFPGPTDLYSLQKNGDTIYFKPTRLINNYLLDRKGIWLNVAFLNITYEQYIKYSDTIQSTESLLKMILDDDPLLEMYYDEKRDVGWDTAVINDIIRNKELEKYFKRLK